MSLEACDQSGGRARVQPPRTSCLSDGAPRSRRTPSSWEESARAGARGGWWHLPRASRSASRAGVRADSQPHAMWLHSGRRPQATGAEAGRPDTKPTAPLAAAARALDYVRQSAPRDAILGVLLTIAQGLVPLVAIYLTKLLVDTAGAALQGGTPDVLRRTTWLVVAAGAIAVGG